MTRTLTASPAAEATLTEQVEKVEQAFRDLQNACFHGSSETSIEYGSTLSPDGSCDGDTVFKAAYDLAIQRIASKVPWPFADAMKRHGAVGDVILTSAPATITQHGFVYVRGEPAPRRARKSFTVNGDGLGSSS